MLLGWTLLPWNPSGETTGAAVSSVLTFSWSNYKVTLGILQIPGCPIKNTMKSLGGSLAGQEAEARGWKVYMASLRQRGEEREG